MVWVCPTSFEQFNRLEERWRFNRKQIQGLPLLSHFPIAASALAWSIDSVGKQVLGRIAGLDVRRIQTHKQLVDF